MRILVRAILFVVFAVPALQAQSAPAASTLNLPQLNTTSGSAPYSTVELNDHEQLNLSSGSLSFSLPIFSLPQRGGGKLNIGFVYQSNVYALKETQNTFSQYSPSPATNPYLIPSQETIEWQTTNPRPWISPLHANLPTLTADLSYAGAAQNQGSGGSTTWTPEYCTQNWIFTDWDGSSHSFSGLRDCTWSSGQWTYPAPLLTGVLEPSMDDGSYIIDASNASDIKIATKDGKIYHFKGYKVPSQVSEGSVQDFTNLYYYQAIFSSMVDPNGNTVTVSPETGGGWTLTDTVGRMVTIGVQGQSISYEGMNGGSAASLSAVISAGPSEGSVPWPYTGQPGPCWAPYVNPPAPQPAFNPPGNMSGNYPSTTSSIITLQNDAQYQLTFDPLGHLIEVQYPSGGYTRYDYEELGQNQQSYGDVKCNAYWWPVIAKHECHSATGSCGMQTTYSTYQSCQAGAPAGGEETTCYGGGSQPTSWQSLDVTDPVGNRTHYDFSVPTTYESGGFLPAYELDRTVYQGSSTAVRTVTTAYGGQSACPSGLNGLFALFPCQVTTTYNDVSPAQTKWVKTQYDATSRIGNPTQIQESDFAGNAIRTTTMSWEDAGIYANNANQATPLSFPSHLLDRLQSKTVTDNVQNKSLTTTSGYDAVGNLSSVTTSGTKVKSSEVQYLNAASNYGSPTAYVDAMGNQTTLSYSTNWSYDSDCSPGSQYNALLSNVVGFVTASTDPMGLETQYQYYSCTGLLAAVTDPNQQVTRYDYDTLGRVLHEYHPDKGVVTYGYSVSAPLTVTESSTMDAAGDTYESETILDGYGNPVVSDVLSDGNGILETDTCYDALENKQSVSNPYYGSSSTTNPSCNQTGVGYTTYSYSTAAGYDPFGRVQTITRQDGNKFNYQYSGVTTKETDEGNGTTGVQRISQSDALGNIAAVCEIASATDASGNVPASCQQTLASGEAPIAISGTGFLTTYKYDGFDNLVGVSQGSVLRSFVYDGLSRLTNATNAESGSTNYQYVNSGGAFCSPSMSTVCVKTDARSIKATYSYDNDGRLTGKAYSDSTPSVSYSYGPSTGTSTTFGIGRLVSENTTAGSQLLSERNIAAYDQMGRINNESQCTPANCSGTFFGLTYTWDYLSDLTSTTNGVNNPGILLSYDYDTARRLTEVSSSWDNSGGDQQHPAILFYAPSSSYGPFGLTSASYGLNEIGSSAGLTLARSYDPLRMRITANAYTGHEQIAAAAGSGTVTIAGTEQSKGTPTDSTGSVAISGAEQNTQKQTAAATSSSGTISVTGSEQSKTIAATSGSGSLTINGSERSATIQVSCGPNGQTCPQTIYDSGPITVTINGTVYNGGNGYGQTSTAAGLASSIGSEINSGPDTNATVSGSTIQLKSRATGASTNYSISGASSTGNPSYFSGASFTVSPSGSTLTGGTNASTLYDSGTVSASFDGCTGSYNWGQSDTSTSIASGLRSSIGSNCSSIVTVSVSGSAISLTSKSTGSGTNWAITTGITHNSSQFSTVPFSAAGSGMAGGKNATDTTVYDAGTVTLTVNGYAKSISFGQSDTPSSIASKLASAIAGDSSDPATATASSQTVTLTSRQAGASVNYSVSASDTYDTTDFSASSFTVSPSSLTMSGGSSGNGAPVYDTGTVTLVVNGTSETTTYGQGDSASSIASRLAGLFSGDASVSLTPSGGSIAITATTTGSATDYAYSVSSTYSTGNFSSPSFTGSPASGNLAGGANASDSQSVTAYSYSIPQSTGYAPDGDIIAFNDSVMGNWTFGYDQFNRLQFASASSGPYASLTLAPSYDRFGNRRSQNPGGDPPTSIYQPATMTFTSNGNSSGNVDNHINGYGYDASGDITSDTLNQYAYDAEGRVCAVYSGGAYTGYVYDAEGARVAKLSLGSLSCNLSNSASYTLKNSYILGPHNEQLSELGSNPSTWNHTNIFAGSNLIATYSGSVTNFLLPDWLGTRRVETDALGNVQCSWLSLPFGDSMSTVGSCTDPTEHHYTGKERDPESGNDYFGARYYASTMGRFLSPDWSAKEQPVPYAKLDDPQTLNLYQYMRNNPLGGTDPDGHCDWCWDVITAVSTSVGAYVAAHPAVGDALQKLGDSIGIKGQVGIGRKVTLGGVKLGAAASVTTESRVDGTGSSKVQLTGAASVDGVGVQGNGTATFEKNGSLVNPLDNLSGNAKLTGSGSHGDNINSNVAVGTDDRVGVGVGVNVGVAQAGVQVTAGTQEVQGVATAVVNSVVQDTRRTIQVTNNCTSSGCAVPTNP